MASTADTFGWDTVFAIKFPDVNAAIAAAKASPKTFLLRDAQNPNDTLVLEGTFAEWSLTNGGQGQVLHMVLPISTGTLSRSVTDPTSRAVTTTTLDLAGARATIEVSLELLPQDVTTATNAGKQSLKLKTRATSGKLPVTVLRLDLAPNNQGTLLQRETAKAMLQSYLGEHLREFNHVFATVDLSQRADIEGFKWLLPTATGYAVATENLKLEDCVFAVLSMTEGREKTAGKLAHAVSASAIPKGARSGFLISSERFLDRVLMPALPLLFSGATAEDFSIGDDGKEVSNNKRLEFQPLEVQPGTVVNPTIDAFNFKISIDGSRLKLALDTMDFAFSPGMNAAVRFISYGKVGLDNGKRIELKMTDASTAGSTVEASLGLEVSTIVGGLALLIVGSAIGVFAPGEATVVGEAGADIVEGTTTFALNDLSVQVTDDATTLGASALNANPITGGAMDIVAAASAEGATAPFSGWLARNWTRLGLVTASVLTGGGIVSVFPILTAVQKGYLSQIPSLEKFTATAVQPVAWPTASKFTLTSAELSGSLQLGGDPGFLGAGASR